MQILLNQEDLERIVGIHISNTMMYPFGASLAVELVAGRGDNGIRCTVDVVVNSPQEETPADLPFEPDTKVEAETPKEAPKTRGGFGRKRQAEEAAVTAPVEPVPAEMVTEVAEAQAEEAGETMAEENAAEDAETVTEEVVEPTTAPEPEVQPEPEAPKPPVRSLFSGLRKPVNS